MRLEELSDLLCDLEQELLFAQLLVGLLLLSELLSGLPQVALGLLLLTLGLTEVALLEGLLCRRRALLRALQRARVPRRVVLLELVHERVHALAELFLSLSDLFCARLVFGRLGLNALFHGLDRIVEGLHRAALL